MYMIFKKMIAMLNETARRRAVIAEPSVHFISCLWSLIVLDMTQVTAQGVTAELGSIGGQQSRKNVAEYDFPKGSHYAEVVCWRGPGLALSLERCTHAVIALRRYHLCHRMALDASIEKGAAAFVFENVQKQMVLLQFSPTLGYYRFAEPVTGQALFLYGKPAAKQVKLPRFTLLLDLSG